MRDPTDAEAADTASQPDSSHRGAQLPRVVGDEYLHWHQPVDDGQGYFHLIKEN
ncbi:MAG: hypothetical protein J7598_21710 [Mitsuaria chitosanitabida]|uniref:hypothetical protein n=1 Tax=Roseateles chitosanitabidus TaxID=65048 RepID=UPI001B1A7885|nr:hypothetical protein [Roseateles chitosanitabidus]MBO9689230.1 hypothetical protein [Roseateles chitosanitabidus]